MLHQRSNVVALCRFDALGFALAWWYVYVHLVLDYLSIYPLADMDARTDGGQTDDSGR